MPVGDLMYDSTLQRFLSLRLQFSFGTITRFFTVSAQPFVCGVSTVGILAYSLCSISPISSEEALCGGPSFPRLQCPPRPSCRSPRTHCGSRSHWPKASLVSSAWRLNSRSRNVFSANGQLRFSLGSYVRAMCVRACVRACMHACYVRTCVHTMCERACTLCTSVRVCYVRAYP